MDIIDPDSLPTQARSHRRLGAATAALVVMAVAFTGSAVRAAPEPSAAVTFDSEPSGAEVRVDGRLVCKETPCVAVLVGKHTVVMKAPSHAARSESLELEPGQLVRWVLTQEFGSVFVESRPPGLMLQVDGGPAPPTPTTLQLAPGKHQVRVMSPCYEADVQGVTVVASAHAAIRFDPRARVRSVDFTAEDSKGRPLRAEILLGGRDGRVIGATPGRFKVPACARTVTLRHSQWGHSEVLIDGGAVAVKGLLDGSNHRLLRLGGHLLENAGSQRPRVLVTLINEYYCNTCPSLRHVMRFLRAYKDVHVTVIHNPSFRFRHALATLAALAAGRQGKFWTMFSSLHRQHSRLGSAELQHLARRNGLDVGWFSRDMMDPTRRGSAPLASTGRLWVAPPRPAAGVREWGLASTGRTWVASSR